MTAQHHRLSTAMVRSINNSNYVYQDIILFITLTVERYLEMIESKTSTLE